MIEFDLSKVKFHELMETMDGGEIPADREEKVRELVSRVVKKWDYEVPVSQGLDALPVGADVRVYREFNELIEKINTSIATDGLLVDFSAWSSGKFRKVQQLVKDNPRKYMQEVEDIVAHDYDVPLRELDALEGLRVMAAIRRKYEDVLNGKN